MSNTLIWYKRISQKFGVDFFFPGSFSYSRYSLGFHILSGCRKTEGANYGQRLKMGPSLIIGIMGHSTTVFATNLIS